MKKFLVFLLSLFVSTNMSAQLEFMPEAGISIYKKNFAKARVSPHIGVGLDYFFNKEHTGWGISSGLYYYQKNTNSSIATMSYSDDGKDVVGFLSYNFNTRRQYLQLPVMVKYKFKIGDDYAFALSSGIYLACGLTGKYDSTDYGYDVNKQKVFYYQDAGNPFDLDSFNRLDVGFRSRASFYAKRLVVNLDYETNLYKRKQSQDNMISLGVGYLF